ncbi:hypothetical protein [Winogradskyella alexanderae]|uniref:Uncharacterized protein n=1 Tax=Winogradskyella alexanderae TaxID=2877123 RepID=A0ABS7XUH4_9FLAO|nr:hypothetical protein [Winogradskyella alexanderae]MCA0133681.1 hypothetical protein [Winogradskyella alexanderae]
MKTLKMFVLAVAVTFSVSLSASENPIKNAEPKTVTETVGDLLKNPDLQLTSEVNAIVDLVINENNEMVVLNVETDNESVENYIKYRLNYKKLSKEAIGFNRAFRVPVKLIQTDY